MRSASRFVPRFDALESHVCLSDLLLSSASSTWIPASPTSPATVETVIVPLVTIDPSQPLIDPTGSLPGVDGTMPTTPGVNLDVYPPSAGFVLPGVIAVPGIPQVPVTPQDRGGIFDVPFPQYYQVIPQNAPNPAPYYPPPYGVPTYVTLSSMPIANVT